MALYRHGDILVESVDEVTETVRTLNHLVLAEGELTGHTHRIADKSTATLYQSTIRQDMFLEVTAETAVLIHQEHGPIQLPRGSYRVWRQREYSPQEIRFVRD